MNQYIVVRGDNLSRIARRSGLRSWRELYYHPANARFRAQRPDPNLIHPGDRLLIPDAIAGTVIPPPRRRAHPKQRESKDEADLRESGVEAAKHTLVRDTELAGTRWRDKVVRFLTTLSQRGAEQLRQQGVQALLFGEASIRSPVKMGQTHSDWSKKKVHDGTKIYRRQRIRTRLRDSAIVVFLDFSTLRLPPNTIIIVYGPSQRKARRLTSRAKLERGTLKDHLKELDGR